jgi:hypothetical protein
MNARTGAVWSLTDATLRTVAADHDTGPMLDWSPCTGTSTAGWRVPPVIVEQNGAFALRSA